jgi:hypothetical protein
MKRLLLATLGLSPGVVTGAYFKLRREDVPIHQVVTVSTKSPATRQAEQMVWETLEASESPPEYQPLRAVKASDLGNPLATQQFMDFMRTRLEAYSREYEIDLILTGGRTSMAAAAMLAVQQLTFFEPKIAGRLHLYHLEVLDPELEERGQISRLKAMQPADRIPYLNPADNQIGLVQIPILSLKDKPAALWARLFEYAVGAHLMEAHAYQQVRYSFKPAYLRNKKGLGEVDVYAEKPRPGAIEAVEQVDHATLRGLLAQSFNREELKRLCFDLHINHEEFESQTLSGMARELVGYAERHGRLTELLQACEARRPKHPWRDAAHLRQALICECKLRIVDNPADKPVTEEEVRRLANKVAAVRLNDKSRQVIGWLVSNTPRVEERALKLADEQQIQIFKADLPGTWKQRADWKIVGNLQRLTRDAVA